MTDDGARISSRRVHTGRVLNLDIDRVRFPNGREGELEMIRHAGACAVVPFLGDPTADDPRILLLRQYRYAAESYLYEIPAGVLAPGEEPEACARRELAEETGCTAERVEHMITVYSTPGFTDERIHLYLAAGLTEGVTEHEDDEFIEVEAMSLGRALELVERGEIKDGKTLIGILFAARYRVGRR